MIALSPREPIAFQRVWCLFEIWTAIENNVTLLPTMSTETFDYFAETSKTLFDSNPKLREPVPTGDRAMIDKRKKVTDEFYEKFKIEMSKKINVHIEKAQATVPADIDLILGLVRESVGVEKLNSTIYERVCSQLWSRIENEFGYSKAVFCFDGEGLVEMWDGTFKAVKNVRIGKRS